MRTLLLLTLAAASAMAQVTSVPAATGTSTGGASADGTVQKGNGSGGFSGTSVTDNGTTVSTAEPLAAKSATTGDGTASGIQCVNGLSSGSVCFAAADTAGTAIAYIYPSANGVAGQVMKDNGVTTCPTLPAGSPATCHQMAWASVSGPQVLCSSGTASSTTNATAEANLGTCTIPAGTLSTTSRVTVTVLYKFVGTTGTGAKVPAIRLSTTSGDTTTGFLFYAGGGVQATLSVYAMPGFQNANSASVQVANAGTFGNGSATLASGGTINTANTSYLNFNCNVNNSADTCQLIAYSVVMF